MSSLNGSLLDKYGGWSPRLLARCFLAANLRPRLALLFVVTCSILVSRMNLDTEYAIILHAMVD